MATALNSFQTQMVVTIAEDRFVPEQNRPLATFTSVVCNKIGDKSVLDSLIIAGLVWCTGLSKYCVVGLTEAGAVEYRRIKTA